MTSVMAWQNWLLHHPLYFGLVFIVGWLSVSLYFSVITGWRTLAEKYLAKEKPKSKLIQGVSVSWGSSALAGNIYTFASIEKGLYLSVLFPFRFGHPPVLVPWRDVKARRVQKLLSKKVEFSIGGDLCRPFTISERVAEILKAGSGDQLQF